MLISMPTRTSTIFGVFQVIRVLLSQRHNCRCTYDRGYAESGIGRIHDHLLLTMVGRRTHISR